MARRRGKSEADKLADGLLNTLMALPWWAGPVVAGLAFVVFRFVIPLLIQQLSVGESNNVGVNVMTKMLTQVLGGLPAMLAPLIAGGVILVWLVTLYKKQERRQLLNKTTELDKVRSLHWQEFEHLVGEYYRRRGYAVQERGGSAPDGGVDIVISKDGRRTLVQCKHWRVVKVGVELVRELLGVVTHASAHGGILVTSGQFTTEAYDFAEQNPIEMIDGDHLMKMIRSVQDARHETPVQQFRSQVPTQGPAPSTPQPPTCPLCGSPMLLRTARKGAAAGSQFYGCSKYPACRGVRNIAGV